jgi:hypothetical protein
MLTSNSVALNIPVNQLTQLCTVVSQVRLSPGDPPSRILKNRGNNAEHAMGSELRAIGVAFLLAQY